MWRNEGQLSTTAKWAQTDSEVTHYSNIACQCLKVMGGLQPYLTLTLRNKTAVRGWLVRLTQGRNAEQDLAMIPTAWRGSIILQCGEREIDYDFLEIETVRSGTPPKRMSGDAARVARADLP
jgi:hypothetical protein